MPHRVRRATQWTAYSGVVLATDEADRLALDPAPNESDVGAIGVDDDGRISILFDYDPPDWRYLAQPLKVGFNLLRAALDGTDVQLSDTISEVYIESITANSAIWLPENPIDGQEVRISDISGAIGAPPSVTIRPTPGSSAIINLGFFILWTTSWLSVRLKYRAASDIWTIIVE